METLATRPNPPRGTAELWTPTSDPASRVGGLQVWIPDSAREKRKVYSCFCGTRFPEHQKAQWLRHTVACSKKNSEVIDEAVAVKRDPRYGGSAFSMIGDQEHYSWLRKRMSEGRLRTVKQRLGIK